MDFEGNARVDRFYDDMAVVFLEKIMRRRRWLVCDRDRVAAFLKLTVRKARVAHPVED